jgi:hypothetical protein
MSKSKKLKKLLTLILAVISTLTFAACGSSFKYDKDAAVKKAEQVIDTINKRDYQAVFNTFNDEMQKLLPAEELKKGYDPLLDASGAFKEYAEAQTQGVTQKGVDWIVVVVSAKYDNNTRVYTISLTPDDKMLVGGLYMK